MAQVEALRRETAVTLGLIGLGGAVGTLLRYLLSQAIPTPNGLPLGILIINVVGAFLLGAFVGYLAVNGTRDLRERRLRFLVATGIMGGFTTYSSFADDSAMLLDQQRLTAAVLYIATTLILGGIASWLGIVTGHSIGGDSASGEGSPSADSQADGSAS